MQKSPKHTVHFEINDIGAVRVLPRWMKSRGIAKANPDGKGQLCCFDRNGDFAGKIIFRNQALTGRAIKQIGKHCRTIQGANAP